MRVVSGHQPVYLPWLGLFQKLVLADVFVVMDDVQYLEQDWNNRNYIKQKSGRLRLTVPVSAKRSHSGLIRDIRICSDGDLAGSGHWQRSHYRAILSCYARAPYFARHAPFLETLYLAGKWKWLHDLNLKILRYFIRELGIDVELVIASEYGFKGAKSGLVLDHCLKLNADVCVLGEHGKSYIDRESFYRNGIWLYFQKYRHPEYPQLFEPFVSHLSVLDLLMNAGPESLDILMRGNASRRLLLEAVERTDRPATVLREEDHDANDLV